MQIGGAAPYVATSPSPLPARPGSPTISPDLAPPAPAVAAPARSLPAEEPAPAERRALRPFRNNARNKSVWPSQQALPPAPNLEVYRRLAEVQAPAPLVDLVA